MRPSEAVSRPCVGVHWFGGIYRGDMKYFFPNMAVEPESFLQIYPEVMLPEDQKQAWRALREA
jgi:putative ABC transport system permease protein